MLTGLSTYLFLEEQLSLARLQSIRAAGFERVEIFSLKPHFDYSNPEIKKQIGSWLADQGSFLHSIHTPFFTDYQALHHGEGLSIANPEKVRRLKAVDEIRRSLELAELSPFPFAVVHMGAPGDPCQEMYLEALYYSLEMLTPFAADRGVTLLLENIPNALSPVKTIGQFLEESRLDGVGVCFDVGHSHLQGDPAEEIITGASRIRSTHLHDNQRRKDDHLFPFRGTLNWKRTLASFLKSGFRGCYLLELRARGMDAMEELAEAQKVVDRFQRLHDEIEMEKNREE